jgi:hypothetical protein
MPKRRSVGFRSQPESSAKLKSEDGLTSLVEDKLHRHLHGSRPALVEGCAHLLGQRRLSHWRWTMDTVPFFPDWVYETFRSQGRVLYDLGLRKTRPPQGKYNSAQKLAYAAIVLMGFSSLVTGIAIYRPTQLPWLTFLFGGYEAARLLYFLLMLGYIAFLLIHIAQVIRTGWNNFRSMVIGAELVTELEAIPRE